VYPKNAATPPRIYVGPVVQISDGAVQTSGVAVTVTPEGGSETAGGGTVAYSTKGGVWYTPTQAETNYSAFMVEASKSGCIPAGVVVVTTDSSTAGQVNVKTNQDKTGYTASTVSDKTGYALTTAPPTAADIKTAIEAAGSTLATLLSRIVGTIAAGTHTAQSGDAYPVVNSGTYGNAAIKTLADTLASYVDTEVAAILAAVDTEVATLVTELAKVPKSDGTVVLNATALASIKTALALLTVDIRKINNATLTGDGSVATPWGPA